MTQNSSTKQQAFQPARGTRDIYGETYQRHQFILNKALHLAQCYGFQPIETPIFEYAGVFHRTLGDTSDIVGKETYDFPDRGGDLLTLRPEGTAGAVRAIISNGLAQSLPVKIHYAGPMFRYERPQKGRYRQFNQIGVECLGLADPYSDVECIAMGVELLNELGLKARLEINTLGDNESRQAYRQALVSYLETHASALSEDSQSRLTRNPLRILDSKNEGDQAILKNAPIFDDYLTESAKAYYQAVRQGLDVLGIPSTHSSRLVRGLDYYTHTVFEIIHDDLGAQSTVLAGGRYDGLMEQLGGQPTPGVGWALGVDRTALLLSGAPEKTRPIAVIAVTDDERPMALRLAFELRRQGYTAELCYGNNMGKRMKYANRINARHVLIIGPDEWAQGNLLIKSLDSGEQETISREHLLGYLSTH